MLPPIEPFRTNNRLATAIVFGILAFEVLKIFEQLLFSLSHTGKIGVLKELLIRLTTIVFVGYTFFWKQQHLHYFFLKLFSLQYYPVLASLHLHNVVARFFTCLYIIANIAYTIIREGSCMGYLPFSKQYTVLEEAKLRIVCKLLFSCRKKTCLIRLQLLERPENH